MTGHAFAQVSFKPIVDEGKLEEASMARTVFIRAYESADVEKAVRSTGVLLAGGYFITNEHVMRPHLQGKSVVFHMYVKGKRFHKLEDVYLLGCDPENDLCVLKTKRSYKDSFFTFEGPSFRTTSKEAPLGLFKDEQFYFNGFCSGLPRMQKAKYVDYVTNGYQNSTNENRKATTVSLQFSAVNGDSIACGGDSGGPLFDANLYLYGIVRDFQNATADPKLARNYAVPMDVIRKLFDRFKGAAESNQVQTIDAISELEEIFKKDATSR